MIRVLTKCEGFSDYDQAYSNYFSSTEGHGDLGYGLSSGNGQGNGYYYGAFNADGKGCGKADYSVDVLRKITCWDSIL